MNSSIPLARPTFGPEEAAAVQQVLESGWVSQGPKVEDFEKRLAQLLDCREVCAVNSGTSALMLALRALGVGPGDSVVVPAFSCAASALPVLETGARIRFADIDPDTLNVNWPEIERALAPDTKAVIAVHLFGRAAEIDVIAAECRRRNLALIEDAALAFGARKAGRALGTFGVAGCFSFHPRKIITTGEGGAVCTNDPALAAIIRSDRNYGAAQTAWRRFQTSDGSPQGFNRVAFNCKLTDLQAAIGLVQLNRLDGLLAERQRIAARYNAALAASKWLRSLAVPKDPEEHVFQAYVCSSPTGTLRELATDTVWLAAAEQALEQKKAVLKSSGIAVSDAAQYLPALPVFAGETKDQVCPLARAAARLTFALPIYPGMTKAQEERVIAAMRGPGQ